VLAKAGESYAVYLPSGEVGGVLDLSTAPANFQRRWFNPRSGAFEGEALVVQGGGLLALGAPPSAPAEDWVVLLQLADEEPAAPQPAAPDPAVLLPTNTPVPVATAPGDTPLAATTTRPAEAPAAVALATSLTATTPAVTMIAVATLPAATATPTLLPIRPTLAAPVAGAAGYSATELVVVAFVSLTVATAVAVGVTKPLTGVSNAFKHEKTSI
jgi:hypothetical protein